VISIKATQNPFSVNAEDGAKVSRPGISAKQQVRNKPAEGWEKPVKEATACRKSKGKKEPGLQSGEDRKARGIIRISTK
jgi:hypothetical protein